MKGYKKNSMVTARRMEDEMFLVPLSDDIKKIRKIYKLNELGWFIWQVIEDAEDLDDLSSIIAGEFDVETSLALKDAEKFIKELIQAGALSLEGET